MITLPGLREGAIIPVNLNGSLDANGQWQNIYSSQSIVLDGDSGRQDALVTLQWPSAAVIGDETLSYTSYGYWGDDINIDGQASSGTAGIFAYGQATDPARIPTSGTATFDGVVVGSSGNAYAGGGLYLDYVTGTAQFRFDFGAGTLAGEMNPSVCPWECYSLGTYQFVQTVLGVGSNSFSGSFAIDGVEVPSWFEGNFNGPDASELMARWKAPFTYPSTTEGGQMAGIIVAKKK
ncbi:transferrin-binding protein-like solute binding protein [Qipengyuania oceanensis]|uniref:Transferrin-binding protein B C-lobe/N-lobe beta-barrel domain-containing protein n=1 Tax=Qipengyuania oceanensis TaxID=1463597 RepID=A0A844YKF8_9SPHN|nr:transferrin-binding protein-like solute binding protein [Qipengyuania oceanensis]MXO63839.1 hypothetical protein [Qipengyuania oceanensis]